MDHFQYLLLMTCCLTVTAPLEFLGARVYRQPARLTRAVLPVAVIFLAWDALAIAGGVWTYNPRYVAGVPLPFRVPVEELVFFLVVPVCGLLTYGCVQALLPQLRRRGSRRARARASLRAACEPRRASH